ncbi:MAG: protein-disulfide reductase DsbD domain-containing protein [Pyrinomonadaceae bacterium]
MNQFTPRLIFPCALLVALLSACAHDSSPTNAPANSSNSNAAVVSPTSAPAKKSPLEGIASASVEPVEMSPGATAKTSVRLTIASGYHVNANPASERFLIPTTLEVTPEAGIAADKFIYPKPLTKKFPFAETPLAVYEGEAVIMLTLRAPRDTSPGQHALRARVRVQPCDDEKCYPPATIDTSVPVIIR